MRSSHGNNCKRRISFLCRGQRGHDLVDIFVHDRAGPSPFPGKRLFFRCGPASGHRMRGSYGIESMISGTLWIALLATALALPLSLGTAFVITSLGGTASARNILDALIRFMTGIPTVIYGFVGIFLLVPLVREGWVAPGCACSRPGSCWPY